MLLRQCGFRLKLGVLRVHAKIGVVNNSNSPRPQDLCKFFMIGFDHVLIEWSNGVPRERTLMRIGEFFDYLRNSGVRNVLPV